jgi:hypothetical protein
MKTMFIILLMVTFFGINCQNKINSGWKIINSQGFKSSNIDFSEMFYLSEDTGFMIGGEMLTGSEDGLENLTWSRKAVVYKTVDKGENWHELFVCKGGDFNRYLKNGDDLYLIMNSLSQGQDADYTYIYKSENSGDSWKMLTSLNSYVRSLLFTNNMWYITLRNKDDNDFQLYNSKSIDSVSRWNKIDIENYPLYEESTIGDNICFLSTSNKSNGYFKDVLIKQSAAKKELIMLPEGFNADKFITHNNSTYFAGMKKNNLEIYKLDSANHFKLLYSSQQGGRFPISIDIALDHIFVVCGTKEGIYNTFDILHSKDNGKTWEFEELEALIFSPSSIFVNNKHEIISNFYSGAGRFYNKAWF